MSSPISYSVVGGANGTTNGTGGIITGAIRVTGGINGTIATGETSDFLFTDYSNWTNATTTTTSLAATGGPTLWFDALLYTITPIGILLNLLFLFTVARVPSLRTTTNYYLVNLALADLTYLVVYPISITVGIQLTATSTRYQMMAFFNVIKNTMNVASAFIIMVVGVERLIAIHWPFTSRQITSKARTVKLLVAIWLLALAFSAPLVPMSLGTRVGRGELDLLLAVYMLPFFVSFVAVLAVYSAVIYRMTCYIESDQYSRSVQSAVRVERLQVVRMLAITAAVFFGCMAPYLAINLMAFVGSHVIPQPLAMFCYLLLTLNSSLNMVIYNATSERYRQGLLQALNCTARPPPGLAQETSMSQINGGVSLPKSTTYQSQSSHLTIRYSEVNTEEEINKLSSSPS